MIVWIGNYSKYIIYSILIMVASSLFSCDFLKSINRKHNSMRKPNKPCILDYPGKPAGSPEKENLGSNVNSIYDELVPVVSPDGNTLYFVRVGHPNNKEGAKLEHNHLSLDIWVSELKDDQWQEAYNIGAPLNNKDPNGIVNISPDGTKILLLNDYNSDQIDQKFFSISHLNLDKENKLSWSFPEGLKIDKFYTYFIGVSAVLSFDGKILIFSLIREDSRGYRDLYFSRQLEDNTWSAPQNMGDVLNTGGDETTPFLAADGKTLYFASDGHCTYGGWDILYSKRLDDSWTNWSKPVNLGPEINTPDSENGYFLTAKGDYAYFTTFIKKDNDSIDTDIFRIKIPQESQPEPVYLVTGSVINQVTNEKMDATIYYDDRETGEELGVANTDPATKIYKLILPKGKDYGLRAYVEGCMAFSKNLSSKDLEQYEEFELDLPVNPVVKNTPIVIENIYFDTGKYTLKKESFYELNRLYDFLSRNGDYNVEVSGHTDNVGSDEDNMILSKHRAKAIAEYLMAKGIKKSRIRYEGYGETKPIDDNSTSEGRLKNRRVELEFID